MAYAPKKRQYRIRWKVALPLLLFIALVVYAIVSLILPDKKEEVNKFTVCEWNGTKSVEALNKKIAETYMVSDYLYYGESLGLYKDRYGASVDDTMVGKTVELHNICTDETVTLTMDSAVDQKITLEALSPGFYDVTIIDNLVKKRIVFKDPLKSEPFYTAKRKNSVNKVTLLADTTLLKEYGITWKENYLFINVEKAKPNKDNIDVLIDPYGMNTDFQYVADKGNVGNGVSEYSETYDAAMIMKKQLESYGLRVEVSRKDVESEAKKAYGEDGRLANGYKKEARYYISLRFNKSETSPDLSGVEIWHSSHGSSVLGKKIMYGLETNLAMHASSYANGDGSGVSASPVDKEVFDSNIYLRETGGRATLAGQYSELSQKENGSFQDANGMNAIEIDFAYVSNAEDAAFWKANKEAIVKQTAKSFAEGISVINAE